MQCIRYLLVLLLFPIASAVADCNQEQAFNKMMALGVAKGDLQEQMNALQGGAEKNQIMQRWAQLGRETAEVGKFLASQEFTVACREYDKIAAKFKIDLDEVSKRAPTLEGIKEG